jgi:hypothetical protein
MWGFGDKAEPQPEKHEARAQDHDGTQLSSPFTTEHEFHDKGNLGRYMKWVARLGVPARLETPSRPRFACLGPSPFATEHDIWNLGRCLERVTRLGDLARLRVGLPARGRAPSSSQRNTKGQDCDVYMLTPASCPDLVISSGED